MLFSTSNNLSILKNEIEIFNPELKLLRDSSWLLLEETRQSKRHASIVFAVNNAEQAKKAVRKKLYIARLQLITESYKSANKKTQCQKYQKPEHSTKDYLNQAYCQICAKKHYIK